MRSLRAIFFDVDDTLFPTTDFALQARENSVDAMIEAGLRVDRDALLNELYEVSQEFGSNDDRHYNRLLQRFPRSAYEPANPIFIVAAAVVAYHETKFRTLAPYEDALEVLRLLSGTDLVRGVITAGLSVKQAEKLLRLRLYRYLTPTALFISDAVGISKPNVKLYRRACDEVGVDPGEAMMVGDHPAGDIDPPNRLGMHTCRVRRGGKYATVEGETAADHEITDFWQLLEILETRFGVVVSNVPSDTKRVARPG